MQTVSTMALCASPGPSPGAHPVTSDTASHYKAAERPCRAAQWPRACARWDMFHRPAARSASRACRQVVGVGSILLGHPVEVERFTCLAHREASARREAGKLGTRRARVRRTAAWRGTRCRRVARQRASRLRCSSESRMHEGHNCLRMGLNWLYGTARQGFDENPCYSRHCLLTSRQIVSADTTSYTRPARRRMSFAVPPQIP